MKTFLLIINWILGWLLITYNGDNPLLALVAVGWFCFSSLLLNHNRRDVYKSIAKFERKLDRLMTKQK